MWDLFLIKRKAMRYAWPFMLPSVKRCKQSVSFEAVLQSFRGEVRVRSTV